MNDHTDIINMLSIIWHDMYIRNCYDAGILPEDIYLDYLKSQAEMISKATEKNENR